MITQVIARCPTRVDLAGGTLDIWPIPNMLKEKATVNVAIQLYARAKISLSQDESFHIQSVDQRMSLTGSFDKITQHSSELPLITKALSHVWQGDLPPLEIVTECTSPKGAGIGGSSSLCIALLSALQRFKALFTNSLDKICEEELVRTAGNLESQVIEIPTGIQDYWAALRGGVNLIQYDFTGPKVATIWPEAQANNLSEWMILCYSGVSRQSAINNWEVFKRVFDKDRLVLDTFDKIGSLSNQVAQTLWQGQIHDALTASEKEWELRKKLWPAIETPHTQEIHKQAVSAGAWFTRVCGAGGGGVMAVFVDPKNKAAVEKHLRSRDIEVLNVQLDQEGLFFES